MDVDAETAPQARVVGLVRNDREIDDAVGNTLTYIKEKKIDLVVNIPKNLSKDELNNDYTIRRSAIDFNIPLITNARLASAFINAFCRLSKEDVRIKSWNEY